jgi:DNA polymerase-4
MPGLCRDCLETYPDPAAGAAAQRCPACDSPRLIWHPDLDRLSFAHIDCDAFYASVEKRDRPELRDKPVIVGGGQRGVVSAACYVARLYGVHSAMPMFKALKACPDAVVIRPDMAKYVAVGRTIRERMLALTPMVEPLSIDEAFLDLSGTEALHHGWPARSLARLVKGIEEEMNLTASIGLSYNKFLAKIASDLDKPRGFAVLGYGAAQSFLAEQPVGIIWGVGKSLRATLARDGITLVRHLLPYKEVLQDSTQDAQQPPSRTAGSLPNLGDAALPARGNRGAGCAGMPTGHVSWDARPQETTSLTTYGCS